MLIADIFLHLPEKLYHVTTNNDFINPNSPLHFLAELHPHLAYEEKLRYKKEAQHRYHLLKVLEVTLPRYSIRKRIQAYLAFYFSNVWEDHIDEPFPTITFICPTNADLLYIKRYTKKTLEENQSPEDLQIQCVTSEKVKEFGITGNI